MQAVQHGFVGFNILVFWFSPYTNTTEDLLATQRANEYYVGWYVHKLATICSFFLLSVTKI